jgi:hypothetical protein
MMTLQSFLCVSLSPCLSVILSVCHPVCLSSCLSVILSVCHPVSLSSCLSVILSHLLIHLADLNKS